MSKLFKESNNENSFELFNKKIVYLGTMNDPKYENLINFSAEKILYGRVNRLFLPITIPQSSTKLKSFPTKTSSPLNLKALNFVVDAFTDLRKQFDKCRAIRKIEQNDQYLSSIKVYRSYVNPFEQYNKYLSRIQILLKNDSEMGAEGINNFDKMTNNLLKSMKSAGQANPLTYPAFIKSRKMTINSSGLAIEIADVDPTNDDDKINLFYNSRNWEFYLNTCKSYGFMVDANIPWRIIADIASEPMIEYAKKYNLNDTDSIISSCYEVASFNYYNTFTQNMLDLYNNIKPRSIIKLTECNGKTITNRTKPKEYTNTEILQNSYGQDNFLMLYCKLRFTEEESQYTEEEKRSIIRETLQISKSKSRYFAIKNFESLINKTFDYQGSLGYYVRGQREREQQEIFGETTSTSFTDSSPARRGGGSSGGGQSSSGY
tara:strand:+ start:2896 stop:4191 length:1296 start_codon:yes stop_codon:yes gene_type:complete